MSMLLRLLGFALILGAGYTAALTGGYWWLLLSVSGYAVLTSEAARR
jgi:hypothetical protein